jgi:hypothetical protein
VSGLHRRAISILPRTLAAVQEARYLSRDLHIQVLCALRHGDMITLLPIC